MASYMMPAGQPFIKSRYPMVVGARSHGVGDPNQVGALELLKGSLKNLRPTWKMNWPMAH